MTSPADLPDDIDALKAIILTSQTKMADQDGIIERKKDRIIRLETLLADFKRALYGAKFEKGHLDQYHLVLEDIDTAMAIVHAEDEAVDPPKTVASKSRVDRGVLPKHLPRIEKIIAPDAVTCGCGAERHIIHCPAVDCKAINERGRRRQRAAGYRACAVQGYCHTPPQVCMSVLRGRRDPSI